MKIRCKCHRMQVVTPTPPPIQRRCGPPRRVQSARVLGRLAQHQGVSQRFCITPSFYLTVPTRLKRSRAIDPFESSSMVHAGATGLVDDWRTIISPYGTASPQHLTLNLRTPDRNASLLSPTSSATMTSRASTPSTFSVRDHILTPHASTHYL